jgi:hypothetical protein
MVEGSRTNECRLENNNQAGVSTIFQTHPRLKTKGIKSSMLILEHRGVVLLLPHGIQKKFYAAEPVF